MNLISAKSEKIYIQFLCTVLLGVLVGVMSTKLSFFHVLGLLLCIAGVTVLSKVLQINVFTILVGVAFGVIFFLILYMFGTVHFIDSLMYDTFTIVVFIVLGLFLILPDLKTEVFTFLLLKPFLDYLEVKHIFFINMNEIYIQFEALFIIVWALKRFVLCKKNVTYSIYDLSILVSFILVLISSVVSTFFSYDSIKNINGIIYGIIVPFMIYTIFKNALTSEEKILRFVRVLNDVFLLHNLFTIFIEYSGQSFFNIVNYYYRATGIFGNSGIVTLLQIFVMPFTVYLLLHGNRRDKARGLAGLVMEMAMILLTASRAGIGIIFVYLVVFLLMNFRKSFRILSILACSIPVVYLIFRTKFGSSYEVFITKIGAIFTDSSRVMYLQESLNLLYTDLMRFLFKGIGIDNFYYEYQRSIVADQVYSPHNFFVHVAIEIGIVAGFIYLFIYLISFLSGMSIQHKLKQVSVALFIGLIMYSMISGFGICRFSTEVGVYYQKNNLPIMLLWIALAFQAALTHLGRYNPERLEV